ncbi:glycerophosphodiester phosphodiesterase [Singulisphaera rosea]
MLNLFRQGLIVASRNKPWIIAHRGDSAHAPENTLLAANAGYEAGADAWELDVQLTRDGVPVVIHDESLSRTTDVSARCKCDPRGQSGFLISDFDLDEVQQFDAGSWFLEPGGLRTAAGFGTLDEIDDERRAFIASGQVRIPTLDEALELTKRLDWLVNVEVKSFPATDPRLLEAILDLVIRRGMADRVLISSFDHADVARSARLCPDIPTGVLAVTPVDRPHEYVRDFVGADFYHPSSQILGEESIAYRRRSSAEALRQLDLQALNGANVPVLVYTVNDDRADGLAIHLAQAGVAGLFTDDPGRLRRLFPGERSPDLLG